MNLSIEAIRKAFKTSIRNKYNAKKLSEEDYKKYCKIIDNIPTNTIALLYEVYNSMQKEGKFEMLVNILLNDDFSEDKLNEIKLSVIERNSVCPTYNDEEMNKTIKINAKLLDKLKEYSKEIGLQPEIFHDIIIRKALEQKWKAEIKLENL